MLPTSNLALAEEHIRTRAYLLWEAEGGAHGRDDHYWREAIAQLQAESIQPSLDVSLEPDVAVVAKDQKTSKTGKSVAGKAAKNTAEPAGNGKAKASKKSSENVGTIARDRVANKAAGAVDEPKSAAKKPKTVKKVSEVGEGNAASPAPARPRSLGRLRPASPKFWRSVPRNRELISVSKRDCLHTL